MMKSIASRGLWALLMLFVFAGGGCKKRHSPSGRSRQVRCADLADDFAGALQDSGLATGSGANKVIDALHGQIRETCLQGRLSEKVFACVARVGPRDFSKMVSCLPDDIQALLPDFEIGGRDRSDEDEADQQ